MAGFKYAWWLCSAVGLAAATICMGGTLATAAVPALRQSSCATDALKKMGAACYEFIGPENWDHPTGRTVTLPVAVVSGPDTDPKLTPVFWFEGGPGGNRHLTSENEIRSQLADAASHRLVLIGSRGLRLSKPTLDCPGDELRGENRHFSSRVYGTKSLDERIKEWADIVKACSDKLTKEGVDVSQYSDYHIARDYDAIRQALGFDKIDIWGRSAGGGSVITFLKFYEPHVRAAILEDAWPVPVRDRPQPDVLVAYKQHVVDMLGICVRDNPECARRFPNYPVALDRAMATLNNKPYVTTVASQVDPSGRLKIRIDGTTLFWRLYSAFLSGPGYNELPKVLEAIDRGDYAALDDFFGLDDVDKVVRVNSAFGHHLANLCGSTGKSRPTPDEAIAMIKREPALMGFESQVFCAWWGKDGDVPISLHVLPVSDVPALAIHGQLDMCCGFRSTELLAQTMPNLQRVVFQAQLHSVGGACRRKLLAAFLKSPNEKLDASCKDDIPLKPWVFYEPTRPRAASASSATVTSSCCR